MTYTIEFRPTAVKDLQKLPTAVRKRIAVKLDFYQKPPDPLAYADKLSGFSKAGDYRFRVGQYRIIFDVEKNKIIVLYLEHRREVYRRK